MIKTLWGLNKNGGFKVWTIKVKDGLNGDAYLVINHGKEGGKQTEKTDYFGAGKQGRNAFEQAVFEAKARIKKQEDKNYRESKDDLQEIDILAMLAADYRKQGHRIEYPCYGSIKYDGVRALAKKRNGVVTIESRTSQAYDLPNLQAILTIHMQDGDIWDGEIYKHGYELQDIVSAVKRTDTQKEIDKALRKLEKYVSGLTDLSDAPEYAKLNAELEEAVRIHELRPQLEFHIFDVVSDKTFEERVKDLDELCAITIVSPLIQITEYGYLADEEAMKTFHKFAVAQGFEGAMLRNFKGLYESGKRSADLQKFKEMVDSEFEILDVVADKQGNGVYVCKNDLNDLTFQVVMGSLTDRLKALNEKGSRIGKYLTVDYQTRYKGTLLPQFPCGKLIRDGEVVDGKFLPSI
ncbi:putative DNA ligase [Pseudomonas phage vB_PsyM_KIL3b]|uniref:DNA ligase n=2 Tax=Pseudomonas phage vB_PsyM_KIL1 TaxID=1777065 RepID=A0A142IFT6_9CAUD|nr:putative DNA ligase [Pseudomonas phage vB_PsyM_KIL3]AMR58091.1 putative DNA ligase [Pseudomonas phage vB_PsyM_KIL3b]